MSVDALKCVVWDLDNTLWTGVLTEGDPVAVSGETAAIVRSLDERGILQSIASRNSAPEALDVLERNGLREYFLCPQIHWGAKSSSIRTIADTLNLAPDSFLFVDDDPFERDEVKAQLPSIVTAGPEQLPALMSSPLLSPVVTHDGRLRRLRYLAEARRVDAERAFEGPSEAFLASLGLELTIRPAVISDLLRMEELTGRTHQLNTTGRIYSQDELRRFSTGADHALLAVLLTDRYGDYGHIGLVLIALEDGRWTIELFLLSCRVMNRGIGPALLAHLQRAASQHGSALRVRFVPTDRNRPMLVTLRLAGFRECGRDADTLLLESGRGSMPSPPAHVAVGSAWPSPAVVGAYDAIT